MSRRSALKQLPEFINNALIEKILTNEPCHKVSQWIHEQHGIKVSKSSIFRHAKANVFKFRPLVAAGMAVEKVIKHRRQIEAIGIEKTVKHILCQAGKEKRRNAGIS